MTVQKWKEIVAKKHAEAKPIPNEWRVPAHLLENKSAESRISALDLPRQSGLLTPRELEITEDYDAVALLQKLATKVFSAHEVALAFCKRAAIAHQAVNCLTETMFDEALQRAAYLDERLAKDGKPVGPLHGLPISLKDTFNIKGQYATVGYVSFISKGRADFNSPLVDVLLDAGAVLHVKTNVPQTLWVGDSKNNIFGRTLNPNRLCLTAGGSSGGEGALVAMRGSLIGVGTDIAGSIRIPALCCGVYGFKPSSYRVAYGLQADSVKEGDPLLDLVPPVAGPLTHSVRDASLFLETVVQDKYFEFDHTTFPVPWIPRSLTLPLTIGLVVEGDVPVSPPITRAFNTAAKKLEAAGHRIVRLQKIPSFIDGWELAAKSFDFDADRCAFKWVTDAGEPFIEAVARTCDPKHEPPFTRTLGDLFPESVARDRLKAAWHAIYRDNGLDVVLAPGNNRPAPPHDTYDIPYYTTMWNVVQYPACTIPYLRTDKNIDAQDERVKDYDPEVLDEAPTHIQVVGQPFRDEYLISAVDIIDRVLKEV